jgi:hypothetical protein
MHPPSIATHARRLRTASAFMALTAGAFSPRALHAQQAPPNLRLDGVPAITPATMERTAPYENTRSAELLDFAAEGGSVLIATRFGDVA